MRYVSLGQTGGADVALALNSIFNPLITTGANIFLASEQAKLQRDLLKQQQNIPQPVILPQTGVSQQTLLLIIGGIGLLLILLISLSRSSSSNVQIGEQAGSRITRKIVRRRKPGT